MAEVRVTVGSRIGLHARPAAILAKAAAGAGVPVRIGRTSTEVVDAASVLAVLGLGVKAGEEIVLLADGDGAAAAIDELAALVAKDLDAG